MTRTISMSTVADGPGDERQWAGGSQACEGLGNGGHDLLGADHAQVIVGEERQRAPAHAGAAVEHDRPGLGDRQCAGRDHAVRSVEGIVVERGSVFYLIYGGQPAARDAIGRDDVAGLALFERGRDRGGEVAFGRRDRAGVVVGEAFEEGVEPVLRGLPVLAGDVRLRRAGAGPSALRTRARISSRALILVLDPPVAERLGRRVGEVPCPGPAPTAAGARRA